MRPLDGLLVGVLLEPAKAPSWHPAHAAPRCLVLRLPAAPLALQAIPAGALRLRAGQAGAQARQSYARHSATAGGAAVVTAGGRDGKRGGAVGLRMALSSAFIHLY